MTDILSHGASPLMPSGFGAVVTGGAADPETVRTLALCTGVVVAPGMRFTDILHLYGDRDEDKVITGRGGLPLHTDGILLGTQVDLIVLFAREARELGGDGATLVCDQISAWHEMPDELREVLLRGHMEYIALERGYFTTVPEGWYSIPTFRDYGRVKSLNLALPFGSGDEKASWDVWVPGVPAEESARLRAHLSQERYLYEHRWTEGDLVVIDNQRTLHGRRGLGTGASRKLLRGQVTLDVVADAPGAVTTGI